MNWQEGTKEKRDALLAKYPDKAFGRVKVQRSLDFVYEGTGDYSWQGKIVDVIDLGWVFVMDHQHDEFEIGGVEDAKKLITDLHEAINYCSIFE